MGEPGSSAIVALLEHSARLAERKRGVHGWGEVPSSSAARFCTRAKSGDGSGSLSKAYTMGEPGSSAIVALLEHSARLAERKRGVHGWGEVPVAPASKRASAWTSPRPRPAPDTKTTLSTRLNSGRRLVVPR
jgi:hypothetical protein